MTINCIVQISTYNSSSEPLGSYSLHLKNYNFYIPLANQCLSIVYSNIILLVY